MVELQDAVMARNGDQLGLVMTACEEMALEAWRFALRTMYQICRAAADGRVCDKPR